MKAFYLIILPKIIGCSLGFKQMKKIKLSIINL